jgi:fatty-acyl-CoA synthase
VLYREEHGTRDRPADAQALASVGRPVLGVHVRVVDDDGRALEALGVGEVEVRSPAVTKGYWGDVERTRSATHDGWWRSGDIGYVDDDNRLHILSRVPDVLWCGGSPVYPRHVEEACSLHPAVKEACAVQTARDQPIVVAVSLRSTHRYDAANGRLTAEIHDLVNQHLTAPATVDDIMLFDEIPRSVQGKVLHREVRGAVKTQGGGAPNDQTVG